MATDPYMGFTLPVVGASEDTWGQLLLDALADIGAHRHVIGEGQQVPIAGLRADADWAFSYGGTNYAITALKAIDFTPVAAASTTGYAAALFANATTGNDLFWRSQSGALVRITNGTTLDFVGSGGIGGDYATSGAEVTFVNADDAYYFKQNGSPKPYAIMKSGPVDIYETVTPVPAFRVRQQAPAGLAASYAVTWPAALPGSTAAVQMSATGVLTASNTFTGNVTADDFKHGNMVLALSPHTFQNLTGANENRSVGPIRIATSGGVTGNFVMGIPLRTGDRIKSVTFARFGDGAQDITLIEVYKTSAAGSDTSLGSGSETNPGAAWADTTLDVTDTTLAAGEALTLRIDVSGSNIALGAVRVTYDRP